MVGTARLQLPDRLLRGPRRGPQRLGGVGLGRLGQPRLGLAAAAQLRMGADRSSPAARRDRRRRESPRGRAPSGHESSSASSKASPAALSVSGASSTRKRGSMPTATGWAESSRLQKPWIVVTQAPPRLGSSSRARSEPLIGAPLDLGPDPLAQLGRRLVGEGEGEDRVGRDALLADQPAVAVDHHAGLAGPGPGLDKDLAALASIAARCSSVGPRSLTARPLLRRPRLDRRPIAAADRREVAERRTDPVVAQAGPRARIALDLARPHARRRSRPRGGGRRRAAPRTPPSSTLSVRESP